MTRSAESKEIEREANRSAFTDDELAQLSDTGDVKALLQARGVESIESYDDYGTGFQILSDKSKLVKVPCRIIEWRFSSGDFGEFVSVLLVTPNGDKLIVNDGSTGIYEQLKSITARRIESGRGLPQVGLDLPRGFRVSEYDKELPNGETTRAKTYYLG